jgi:hypothetical protein
MLSGDLQLRAEEHINALAERHRIKVRRSKEWATSEADISSRQVFIPRKIRTGIDYLASLHEIGHIVDPAARRRDQRELGSTGRSGQYEALLMEAAAWAWALKNARPVILQAFTKTDWRRVGTCWASFAGPVW